MEKQPLTNLGIATLIANLYALTQEDLNAEIDTITLDFDSWIITHIDLDQSQQDYLSNLPLDFKENLKLKFINNLVERAPIVFTKAENDNKLRSNAEGRGKLFGVDQKNRSSYSSDLGVITDDTLYVSISYSK
ncbi:hypothetical protein [Sphingobacterium cavernae]|uniref:hypothetical protein n=1 Tax=Sphingobacterium cavernae TaxID=2592657 RepID=UPI00122FCF3E|nr:hypothetical protein [Sphingobacterium cavernae]